MLTPLLLPIFILALGALLLPLLNLIPRMRGLGIVATVTAGLALVALLWLNGTLQGAARGTAERRAGLYLVRIGRPGLAAWVHWFRVKKGQTRELALKLKPAPNIDAAGDALRRAATRPVPGSAVAKLARAHSASEVMLLTSDASCKTNACPVALHWAVGSSWKRQSSGTFTGKPLAATLLGAAPQSTHAAAAVKTCTQNADCPLDQHCSGGMCRRKSTITRKWWFWTLIGLTAAGVATAIAVPLSLPDTPVIKVR